MVYAPFYRRQSSKLRWLALCLCIVSRAFAQTTDQIAEPIDIGQVQRTVVSQTSSSPTGDTTQSLETEITKIVLRQIGFDPQAHYYSYPRNVRALSQGSIGAGIILRYNDHWLASDTTHFSCHKHPYLRLPLSVYKLKDNPDIPNQLNFESLQNFSVGYMRSVGKDVDPLTDQPNFLPNNNMQTLFKMLKSGRIDTVFADIAIAESWSRELNIPLQPLLQLGALESFLCFSNRQYGADKALRLSNAFYDTLRTLDTQGVIDDFLLTHNLGYYRGLYLPAPVPTTDSTPP